MAMSDSGIDDAGSRYPVTDEITGGVVADPDGNPITELEGHDYLGLADSMSLEERASGERAWRFGHVIVDEAQDLTPMQWRMVSRRARGHSMTLVGDLAQRTTGAARSWTDLLPTEIGEVTQFELTTNYRSPEEVARITGPVLAELAPELQPPISIRASGNAPRFVEVDHVAHVSELFDRELQHELQAVEPGRVGVIGVDPPESADARVVSLTPRAAKGMEFDAVIVLEPADIVEQPNGLALLYIALSRTTDRLAVIHSRELPGCLRSRR